MRDVIEDVRQYPGMFVGSTDAYGLQVLPRCFIDHAIDTYLAGKGSTIVVDLQPDGGIRVSSDAITLPVLPATDLPARLRDLFLRPYAAGAREIDVASDLCRPTFVDEGDDYRVSDGFRSGGELGVVNALSRSLTAEIRHGGRRWRQVFHDQRPVDDEASTDHAAGTATIVTLYPDNTIFTGAQIRWEHLYHYLRQSSYLVPGLALRLIDRRQSPALVYEFPPTNGVVQYVLDLTTGQHPFTHPIEVIDDDERTKVHIALLYADGPGTVLSFVNNYRTVHNGAHVNGFLRALRHALARLGERSDTTDAHLLRPSSMTAHLTAIVSVWTPNPLFQRATRSELYNPEVRGRVFEVVKRTLLPYVEENADELRRVLAQLPRRGQ